MQSPVVGQGDTSGLCVQTGLLPVLHGWIRPVVRSGRDANCAVNSGRAVGLAL